MTNPASPPLTLPPIIVQGSPVQNGHTHSENSMAPLPYSSMAPNQHHQSAGSSPNAYPVGSPHHPRPLEPPPDQWALPPGWIVGRQESDGRLYYHEVATGRTSWVHPMAPTQGTDANDVAEEGTRVTWWDKLTGDGHSRSMDAPRRRSGLLDDDVRGGRRSGLLMDTPSNASRRPDSHQCCAMFALLVCFPMGIAALIHSFKVNKAWGRGHYGDAVNHSRQAYNFAWWGTVFGIALLLLWWWSRSDFAMPDWNFDGFD